MVIVVIISIGDKYNMVIEEKMILNNFFYKGSLKNSRFVFFLWILLIFCCLCCIINFVMFLKVLGVELNGIELLILVFR